MMNTTPYSGSLTAEQFLFYEIRIASKLYLQGISVDDAAAKIREDTAFCDVLKQCLESEET